ncbi:hypothetical protein ASPACDRAFT_60087 [Aspergillus aculeatus ATCC 16872]|uniref:Uncharacterized protein n=1 Tax=Aspergillus aculeatus (strain ATCC 16872 / CBS 172.66 / WB 5094) TaxID=690307 RepID=A0A1L9WWD4_ASPA1|nr:uncharacterized protein ASPACDRAFT_60087 [Aspergillus aculeatus ATCC 16872]OJK00238.1 hypothetical protein ASPACDRAFT_60087 [Aspergillus aculeatus ATCC 16872]
MPFKKNRGRRGGNRTQPEPQPEPHAHSNPNPNPYPPPRKIPLLEARDSLIDRLRQHLEHHAHPGIVGAGPPPLQHALCISCIGGAEARACLDLIQVFAFAYAQIQTQTQTQTQPEDTGSAGLKPGDYCLGLWRTPAHHRKFLLEHGASLFPAGWLTRPSISRGGGWFVVDGHRICVEVMEAVIMPFERGRYAAVRLDVPREMEQWGLGVWGGGDGGHGGGGVGEDCEDALRAWACL